ncbi:unc-22, partial [Symbiodinium microadriaticum]
ATHVSPTELLYNWIPLLGATEPDAQIGSTDFSILKGYELWMDDGLGGKFSRTYDGYNKPFETYFVATGLVPRPSVAELLCLLRGSIADSKSTSLSSETKHHGMQTWRSQQCWLRKSNAVAGQI